MLSNSSEDQNVSERFTSGYLLYLSMKKKSARIEKDLKRRFSFFFFVLLIHN